MHLAKKLSLTFLTLLMAISYTSKAHAEIELGQELKEVFVKGSLDSDKLFIILAMKKAYEVFDLPVEHATDIDELKDWSSDSALMLENKELNNWNINHEINSVVQIAKATHLSLENTDGTFKWPWRSLKEIPGTFEVAMKDTTKPEPIEFMGHAIWITIQGTNYLVVEAPITFVAALAKTSLETPANLIYKEDKRNPFTLTIGIPGKVIRLGWVATKAIAVGSIALGKLAYSGLTTGIAVATTTVTAMAIGAFKVTVALIKYPFTYSKKGNVKVSTRISSERMVDLTQSLPGLLSSDILTKLGVNSDLSVGEVLIEDEKAVIKYKSKFNDEKDSLIIKIEMESDSSKNKEQKSLTIEAYMKRAHFKELKSVTDLSNRKLKQLIENNIENLLGNALLIFQRDDSITDKSTELALAI